MRRMTVKVRLFGVLAAALMASALPLSGTASANHGARVLEVMPDAAVVGVDSSHTLTARLCAFPTAPNNNPDTPDTNCAGSAATADTGPFQVDFEFENDPFGTQSANDIDGGTSLMTPDKSCNIPAGSSQCTVTYTGNNSGDDQIRAWIDHTGTNSVVEADTAEQQDERAVPGVQPTGTNPNSPFCNAAGPAEEDCTDVVTVSWTEGAPAAVDCDDAQGPDTERELNPGDEGPAGNETYTCRAFDANGNPTGDADPGPGTAAIVVKGENESGPNDGDNSTSYDSPDHQCTIASSGGNFGRCTETVTQADLQEGTATICWWIGTNEEGATRCTPGNEPTGESQQPNGLDPANDLADQTELRWEVRTAGPGNGGVDAEPETPTSPTGTNHEVDATVYDQFSEPFQGFTQIKFEFFKNSPSDTDGNTPGSPDDTCTTLNASTCSIDFTSIDPGRDLLCVYTHGTPAMSGGPQKGTCKGEGRNDGDDTAGAADAPAPPADDVDVVAKTWTNPDPATELNCEKETKRLRLGNTYRVTCTATNDNGPVEDTAIDAEFTGVNDGDGNTRTSPDDSCKTGNGGSCKIKLRAGRNGQVGTTVARIWIDADYFNGTDESDNAEGRNEATSAGNTAEPDDTDVVQNRWRQAV
jgi:hypothetical protein